MFKKILTFANLFLFFLSSVFRFLTAKMMTKALVTAALVVCCWCSIASGVAISPEPIAQDGDIARHYNSRYSIFDEPYNIEFKYHKYEQMSRFLRATSLRFQNLTALYSIGKSVQGTRTKNIAKTKSSLFLLYKVKLHSQQKV